jgi:hypothetical protein
MRREFTGLAAVALLTLAVPARAQDEASLRSAFEGTKVAVRIDLPASASGIDVYPQRRPALDYPDYAKRIKRYGVALREGERALVTKVRVKKDLIEFQLGGGGYGTFTDDNVTDTVVPSAPKTQREKNLEEDLKREQDPEKRRAISEELDSLRKERAKEDARNEAAVQSAEEAKKKNLADRRLAAGSRINVRFADQTIPGGALTPEGLRTALEEWIDFGAGDGGPPTPAPGGVTALRKGLTRAEVEALLGAALRSTPGNEGSLAVERAEYKGDGHTVTAMFVEGVLVKYSIASD